MAGIILVVYANFYFDKCNMTHIKGQSFFTLGTLIIGQREYLNFEP